MKFNINQNVRVRLTDRGRAILRANFDRLAEGWANAPDYEKVAPKEDADGWSQWQLWYLMQQFGANMAQGADLPFETEIEIIEEQ